MIRLTLLMSCIFLVTFSVNTQDLLSEPDVVYPYHHRGQDIQEFRQLVVVAAVPVEVRL